MSDLVGIDLVAAVKHECEGLVLVRLAQARPHGIALGALTLHVADLFAVAGDMGQTQIADQITGDLVALAVPSVGVGTVGR